jgi:membrane-associated phospholipid phosphatase
MIWFFGIPFSRYLMGVHSLDQLLFGNSLGVVGGFTMHFLVRDHLIRNFDDLIEWQRQLGYIPCVNEEQKSLTASMDMAEK